MKLSPRPNWDGVLFLEIPYWKRTIAFLVLPVTTCHTRYNLSRATGYRCGKTYVSRTEWRRLSGKRHKTVSIPSKYIK
jgi:hypothetical protein